MALRIQEEIYYRIGLIYSHDPALQADGTIRL